MYNVNLYPESFFQIDKYYHKIAGQFNDHYYFKCQKLVNEDTTLPDAVGVELYVSPGGGVARIVLSSHQVSFKDWEEISKDEFLSKTEKFTNRVASDFS